MDLPFTVGEFLILMGVCDRSVVVVFLASIGVILGAVYAIWLYNRVMFGEVKVFHRPHPSPDTDKGAVASTRKWLEMHGVKP